ncbi:MAG: lipopolysaccharide biosynthesis protein [Bacilli bacterium]
MENSRIKNSIRNSSVSLITQILTVLINFIVKTVFIKMLSNEYLGINGLFSNIITMLSLADLGIGMAIPYSLYEPLAKNDKKRIKILMKFYSKIYNIIGIVVLLIGLSLIPFLEFLIKDIPDISHLGFIYSLFVLHSASSYFFIYKKFLVDSDQLSYITSRIVFIFSTILSVVQIIILLLFKNYILFLFASVVFVVLQNLVISSKVNKMYPYIKDKEEGNLNKEDVKDITKNVSSLFIYKVGTVITNGTDNIVISKFIGLIAVGFYSNYLLIINSLNNIVNQIFNSITSSIGNLVVTTNSKRSYRIYENLNFFSFWLYGLCSICIMVMINPFISLWIGSEYTLGIEVVFLLASNLYTMGMQNVTNSFRNSYGLFYIARFRPVIMVIINIVVSILLVQFIGIAGVIIGTIFSRLVTTTWLDPYIVHNHGFKISPKKYYLKYSLYLLVFILTNWIVYFVTSKIIISNIFMWILVGIISVALVNIIFLLIFFKTSEFKYFYNKIISKFRQFK